MPRMCAALGRSPLAERIAARRRTTFSMSARVGRVHVEPAIGACAARAHGTTTVSRSASHAVSRRSALIATARSASSARAHGTTAASRSAAHAASPPVGADRDRAQRHPARAPARRARDHRRVRLVAADRDRVQRQLGPRARDHRRVQPAAHAAVRWSAPIATVAPGRPRTRHPAGRHRSRPHAAPARPARTGPPPCPGRPRTRHRAGRHRSRPRAAQARPTRGTTAASMSTRRSPPARPARAGPPPRPSRTGDRRQLGPRARTTAVSRSAAHAVSPAGRRRSRPRAAPAGPRARDHRRVQISADRDRGSASSARARGTTVGRRRSRSRAALRVHGDQQRR